jgi:hydrogenase 3 maturation protease
VSEELINLLSQRDKKILFVGIGNLLRKDDGAGAYISSGIKGSGTVSALTVEVSIENYIGKINRIGPDILVIIDALDMCSVPGDYKLLNINQTEDMTFNTHNISLRRVSDFFKMPVYLLGIQPENIDFGEKMSYLVKNTADKIISFINTY